MNRHSSVNRVYRLLWSSARNAFIPVAETSRGRVKQSGPSPAAAASSPASRNARGTPERALQLLALVAAIGQGQAALAQGLPQGGVVRAGAATISSTATRMDVTTATSRTAIDWTGFSIAAGNTVDIHQPTSVSLTVNRVVGAAPSQVFGELSSNGQIVLANPNGIWFGPNARVDVAGIVATTSHLSDVGMAAVAGGGAVKFDANAGSASIVNQGSITVADGGLAGLVAPGVRNSGSISARRGTVTLASSSLATIDFYGDGLINLAVSGRSTAPATAVDGSPLKAAVENSGTIMADGGAIHLSANVAAGVLNNVIDMSGVIEARGISTAGGSVELLGGAGSVSVAGTVDVSGAGKYSGGSIAVQAGSAQAATDGIADIAGSLNATSAGGAGGRVSVSGRIVTPSGKISASGASGGSIAIDAATLIQSGSISASGTSGAGGHITLAATDNIVQTSYASTTANSASAAGGGIALTSGTTGRVFSSGAISAQGKVGGDITLLAGSVALAAANINASGSTHGGQILVGGGLHGKGEPAAAATEINPATVLRADALTSGDGGTVVVWSASKTIFQGSASARGGATGGNGGLIEVSSGNDLAFSGSGDAAAGHGKPGTLLLDPKNIVIDSNAGNVAQFNLIDPDSGLGTGFGTLVMQLSNGTVLVTKPGDTVGGAALAGSVFYFNPTTGGLLSTFQGSHAGDHISSAGLTFLSYANYYAYYYAYTSPTFVNDPTKAYIISSPLWNAGAGAITWVAANSTVSGILSSSNSLVGAGAGDSVGSAYNLWLLPNNNYLATTPAWGAGKGAVTFGTAGAALTGTVSSSNSLVGSTANQAATYNELAGDNVGSGGIVMLANNNFVLLSPSWNAQAGAVTFGTETSGTVTGVLGATNSLVGATGAQIYTATNTLNGNSHSSQYYGGDQVGSSSYYIYALANGSYVVLSPDWNHDRGAVTIGSGTTGIVGTVSTVNSLTGITPGVGTGGIGVGTYNGSTYYTSDYGYRGDYGGDQLGNAGITVLANNNWVISSTGWNRGDGASTFLPASTTALGSAGSLANVTTANSLVGSTQSTINWGSAHDASFTGGDSVGYAVALANSNYVATSTAWSGTRGAVTLMDGTNGHVIIASGGTTGETVSAANSLVGSSIGDYIGSVTELTGSSNFVVSSGTWSNGKGSVTRVNGVAGIAGAVTAANSLVGVTPYQTSNSLGGDGVGSSIVALPNGDWVIESPNWNMTTGAVTFELANAIPTGNVSALNSLVGTTPGIIYCQTCANGAPAIFGGDAVGSGGLSLLTNGNFVVQSPQWSANRGAVTFVNGATGALVDGTGSLTGAVSATNSLVGNFAGSVRMSAITVYGNYVGYKYYLGGDQVGSYYSFTQLANGNFLLAEPNWKVQAGAVTFGLAAGTFAGGAAFAGIVGSTNSLVGATSGALTAPPDPTTGNYTVVGGDQLGSAGIQVLTGSNFLILSPFWNGTRGAVTWGGGSVGLSGAVSSANSLVGSTVGDSVGTDGYNNDTTLLADGDYIIGSPKWNSGKGAVTFGTPGTAVTGVITSANSLVGSTAADAVGSGGVTALAGGDYVINSPGWSGGRGAATWSQGTGAVTGVISSTNSILGITLANNSLLTFATLDPKAFFVTLPQDSGGPGRVILAGTDPTVWDFARAQANTLTIAPSLILSALNAGTSILLEASNDITVNSALIANSNATGGLTLDAGRSVLVHASINTGNGALTITGNDSVADGVIDAQRSSGTAVITVDSGAILASGTAALSVNLAASTDKTFNTAGNISLGAVSGASVAITNRGSANGNVTLSGNVTATATGTSILVATGGNFINTAGAALFSPGAGRYLVYSADPRTNTPGGLTDPIHFFGETLTLNGPGTQAASGNIYLYSVVPLLTVTSNSSAGYGTSASALTAQVTGYIDGDTQATSVSGAAALSTAYVAGDAVGGSYAITVGQGSLTSALGYGFSLVNGTVVVTPQTLSIALAGSASKTYDGSNAATLTTGNYLITGLFASDAISVSKTAGTYASLNAGTPISIATLLASGDFTALGGTLLSNYVLPTGSLSGAIGTITTAPLTASLIGSVSKVYDGANTATLTGANYQLTGFIGGQSISVAQPAGTFASNNVGTALGISAALTGANFTAGSGTLLSNYALPTSASGAIGTITGAPLTASLIGSISKVYDGGNVAALSAANYQLTGLIGGQSINVTHAAGTYASSNAGTPISVAATLASGDFSATAGTLLSNYILPTGSISGAIGTITAAPLTASLIGSISKVYNGSNAATLGGVNYQLSGLVGEESISVAQSTGTYASVNAGSGLGVSATLTGGNFTATSGTLLSNYSLPTLAAGAIGTITKASLSASLIGATSKVYDAGNTAILTGANYQLGGLVGDEVITVAQTAGSFASVNVGSGLGVTASLATGNFTAGGATLLSNYTLPTTAAGLIGAITPATLTVSLIGGSVTRTYNGGTAAALASIDYQLTGLVGGQSITVSQTSGQYASPNAGTGIDVTTTLGSGNFTAGTGTLLANYTLPVGTISSNAGTITPAPLTAALIGSATKVYDGNDASILSGANYQLSGLFGDESISVNQASGSYASVNVGTAIGVTTSLAGGNFTAGSNTLLANYSLPTTAAGAIGAITPATLTVSLAPGSVTRVYNGGGIASIDSGDYQLGGLVGGQSITVSPTTGSYASNNAGSGIGVTTTLTGDEFAAGSGTLLSNYVLPLGSFTSAAGIITPAPLTVSLVGSSAKVYDGSNSASLSAANYQLTGLVGDESVNIGQTSGTYTSANAGVALGVVASLTDGNFAAGSETLLSNYILPTMAQGTIGAITPATLTVSLAPGSVSRVYNGGGAATIDASDYRLSGLVPGESISVASTNGSYASDNAGTGISVSTSLAAGDFVAGAGTQLGNYTLPTGTLSGLAGVITPAALTITANPATKIAGAANPPFSVAYTGFVGGESVANLTTEPTVTSPATLTSPAGAYALNASGAVDPNYLFTYIGGVMQVTQNQVTPPPVVIPPVVIPPVVTPVSNPLPTNISNVIQTSVASNISQQNSGAAMPLGDIFLIGQSVSVLPQETDSPAGTTAASADAADAPASASVVANVTVPATDTSGTITSGTTTSGTVTSGTVTSGTVTGDAIHEPVAEADDFENSKRGRRDPDRDVHVSANAYLASIGLGASK